MPRVQNQPAHEAAASRGEAVRRDPQEKTLMWGPLLLIWSASMANVAFGLAYLRWRITSGTISDMKGNESKGIPPANVFFSEEILGFSTNPIALAWAWVFFAAECWLMWATWVGHTQRLFPAKRIKVTMDELVAANTCADSDLYKVKTAILVPTNGERLKTLLQALLGCISQKPWLSTNAREAKFTHKVIVLDEKCRTLVLEAFRAAGELQHMLEDPAYSNSSLLRAELNMASDIPVTPLTLFNSWRLGQLSRTCNNPRLQQVASQLDYMDDLQAIDQELRQRDPMGGNELAFINQRLEELRCQRIRATGTEPPFREITVVPERDVEYNNTFWSHNNTMWEAQTFTQMSYYSRRDVATPKDSPKAGNLNSALFGREPGSPRLCVFSNGQTTASTSSLIGDATVVIVNDCRHRPEYTFLQRTCPYFMALDRKTTPRLTKYTWARDIAFVQTPQRFHLFTDNSSFHLIKDDATELSSFKKLLLNDPLGNHAVVQYDLINRAKDGIGAVSSSGHGSLWRIDALMGQLPGKEPHDFSSQAATPGLGFRSDVFIEDTHTSISLFRKGWRSVYINEKGENLTSCTFAPENATVRLKQVLRWHQGAVQLAFKDSFTIALQYLCGGFVVPRGFPTVFHNIYSLDQAFYVFVAFPGYVLLCMPVNYGFWGIPPFYAQVPEFICVFAPFVLTALLPTAILTITFRADAGRVTQDERVWLSTVYVQMYAVYTVVRSKISAWICSQRDGPAKDRWNRQAPRNPLFLVFLFQIVAILMAGVWTTLFGYGVVDLGCNSGQHPQDNSKCVPGSTWPWVFNVDTYGISFLAVFLSAWLMIRALWPMVALELGLKKPLEGYYMQFVAWTAVFIMSVLYLLVRDHEVGVWKSIVQAWSSV